MQVISAKFFSHLNVPPPVYIYTIGYSSQVSEICEIEQYSKVFI